jgi:biopolymer transport protein ExbB
MQTLHAMQMQAPLVYGGDWMGGLWQALICTAAGLIIAIPAYAGYNLLVSRVETMVLDMDWAAGEIQSFLASREKKNAASVS